MSVNTDYRYNLAKGSQSPLSHHVRDGTCREKFHSIQYNSVQYVKFEPMANSEEADRIETRDLRRLNTHTFA